MFSFLNITIEQVRLIVVTIFSSMFAFFTPTHGFIYALLLTFILNIWAGMRADGVAISHCNNFSMKKFRGALGEFFLYLIIVEALYSIITLTGEKEEALIAAKALTYVFIYVYFQNAFKNLILAYPKKVAIRIIYHVIRLEFKRAMPSYIQDIINRFDPDKKKENKTETKPEEIAK